MFCLAHTMHLLVLILIGGEVTSVPTAITNLSMAWEVSQEFTSCPYSVHGGCAIRQSFELTSVDEKSNRGRFILFSLPQEENSSAGKELSLGFERTSLA